MYDIPDFAIRRRGCDHRFLAMQAASVAPIASSLVLFVIKFAAIKGPTQQTGTHFVLWSPMAVASPKTRVVTSHPDWICHDQDGNIRRMAWMVQVNLASPFRDGELDRLSILIRQNDLHYIRVYLTAIFNTYGEEAGCYGPSGVRGGNDLLFAVALLRRVDAHRCSSSTRASTANSSLVADGKVSGFESPHHAEIFLGKHRLKARRHSSVARSFH